MKGQATVLIDGYIHAFGKERTYGGKKCVDICIAIPAGYSRKAKHAIVYYIWARVKGWGLRELEGARKRDLIRVQGQLYSYHKGERGQKGGRDTIKVAAWRVRVQHGHWVDWENIAERYQDLQYQDPDTLYAEAEDEPDTKVEIVDCTKYVQSDNKKLRPVGETVKVELPDARTQSPEDFAASVEEALRGSGRDED